MHICSCCGQELESAITPHSFQDCVAFVKQSHPLVCEQIVGVERARCAEIVSRFSVDGREWFNTIKVEMQYAMLKD